MSPFTDFGSVSIKCFDIHPPKEIKFKVNDPNIKIKHLLN